MHATRSPPCRTRNWDTNARPSHESPWRETAERACWRRIGFAVLADVIPEIDVDIEQAARDRAEAVAYLGSGDRPSFPMSPVHALEIQADDCEWVGDLAGFGMRNRSTRSKWPKSSTSRIVLGGM